MADTTYCSISARRASIASKPADFLIYRLSGIASLNVLDFDYKRASGRVRAFLAAAHVQSIGSNGASGWVRPQTFAALPCRNLLRASYSPLPWACIL